MKGINHLAVVAAVVFHQILGGLWYSVTPWALPRLAALGKPASDASKVDPAALVLDIVGWILASYVMAWVVRRAEADSAAKGAIIGFVLWLGMQVPTLVPHYAFAGIAPVVTLADISANLVACVVTGAILGAWPAKVPAPAVA